jgi:Flp pilus assembly protein TadD
MLDEAIDDCNELMELDPEDAGAYYVRGCILEKQGKIDESI